MIIHMDISNKIHYDTEKEQSEDPPCVFCFYICKLCEQVPTDITAVNCESCDNVACIILYQDDTLENALIQKRKQYGITIEAVGDKDPCGVKQNSLTGEWNANIVKVDVVEEEECIELKHLKYKSLAQSGTRKDLVGCPKSDSLNTLDKFLEDATATNKTERWNKLDKTIKLQKMTEFADVYAIENEYSDDDKTSLMIYLRDCLDKKKLARVKDVEYDNETDRLIAIPGLQYNRAAKKHTI